MEDQVEGFVRKSRQVAHVPFDCADFQSFTSGHLAVTLQLRGRIVKDGDIGSKRSEYRTLLPTSTCQDQAGPDPWKGGNQSLGTGLVSVNKTEKSPTGLQRWFADPPGW